MKKLILLLLSLLLLFMLVACSEKDDDPITPDATMGYSLDQFITKGVVNDSVDITAADSVDYRSLFAYQIVGSDGWSPRQSSNAGYDLSWNQFKAGYLIPTDEGRTYFTDTTLPHAFRVKYAQTVQLHRKVDVIAPNHSQKMVELNGLTIETIANWDNLNESAVKLSDLLAGATYDSVMFSDPIGYQLVYYPNEIAQGYYLLHSEKTLFPTSLGLSNRKNKFKRLATMTIYGASASQNHTFTLSTQPRVSFDFPSNLSGFQSVEVPGYSK